MEIIDRKISEIIPYDKNPRINNNAVDKTMMALLEFYKKTNTKSIAFAQGGFHRW